ncbi:HNH endonuclease [Kribbella capetownensis]|uniref:HNH endonuclease n=1 Tax=Kribbella capetownensis TaxID=1572659 RepID=A0A4R0KE33_9ACTN|nr:HNH endonuclease signature motif containing protein [Kribbella capetownensis]TCC53725.1 HNH endonuclease [Kribbella capetownensis]
MEILGERPVWSMSDSEKLSTLDAVVAEVARLETIKWQLIAGLDQSGYAKDLGAGDTARLLSQRYRIDGTAAHRDVRVATRLTSHPATTAALPDPSVPFPNPASDVALSDSDASTAGAWRVHPAQADAIMSVLARVPSTVPADDIEFAERQLIDLAATHTPSELRRAGKKIRDILDPDGPEPDEQAAYARESLTLKTADRGVTFRGYLANENAELLRTLIHAQAKPHKTIDSELDPRPRDKRQADALTTVLNTAATAHLTSAPARHIRTSPQPTTATGTAAGTAHTSTAPPTRGTASSSTITPGAETTSTTRTSAPNRTTTADTTGTPTDFANANSDTSTTCAVQGTLPGTTDPHQAIGSVATVVEDGDGSGVDGGFVPGFGPKAQISVTIDFDDLRAATANATGALVFGDDLSAGAIRRLACDAEILPIVLGAKSQPLDVGTSQRLVTRPMRRALNARDKGCVVCGAPPIQCEAHHVVPWLDGGVTAVSNLVLLCKRHHNDLHSGHWHIRIIDGVVRVTRPTWTTPTAIPPGRYQPPPAPSHHPTTPPPRVAPWNDDPEPAVHPSPQTHPQRIDPWNDDPEPAVRASTPPPPTLAAPPPFDPWDDNAFTAIDTQRPRVNHHACSAADLVAESNHFGPSRQHSPDVLEPADAQP